MADLTFADRTTCSFQENVSTTLANGHFDLAMLSPAIITRSPTYLFRKCDVLFCLLVKLWRYSWIRFFQNMSIIACVAFHFARRFVPFSVVVMNLWSDDTLPTKKWFDINYSLGSLVTGVNGRLFTILSISTKKVKFLFCYKVISYDN